MESLSHRWHDGRAEWWISKTKVVFFFLRDTDTVFPAGCWELDKSLERRKDYLMCHRGYIDIQRLSAYRNEYYLMLINLKHDGLQYEGGGGDRVQRLLRLSQPVDEVLQGVVKIRGQLQRFLQFDLLDAAQKSRGQQNINAATAAGRGEGAGGVSLAERNLYSSRGS